jgi:DNA-directed RNA polymerase specialized sigma24 family protein
MSQLAGFLAGLDKEAERKWHSSQVALAEFMIAGLIRRFNVSSDQLPEAEEVVNETVGRILNLTKNYVWDGENPPTLNKFFANCLKRSISALRSKERYRLKYTIKFAATSGVEDRVLPEEATLSGDDVSSKIERLISERRLRGANVVYLRKLLNYASARNNKAEIAADLGVSVETVSTLRKRARRLVEQAIREDDDE